MPLTLRLGLYFGLGFMIGGSVLCNDYVWVIFGLGFRMGGSVRLGSEVRLGSGPKPNPRPSPDPNAKSNPNSYLILATYAQIYDEDEYGVPARNVEAYEGK
eukprot:1007619-Amorphochlora_amoeboformis.AAC.1